MGIEFHGYVEYGNQIVTLGDSSEETELDTDSEYVGLIISDEDVPTGYEEDNCVVHYIMFAITFAFAVYNVVRVIQRAKENIAEGQKSVDTN